MIDPIIIALCCAGISLALSLLTLGYSKLPPFLCKNGNAKPRILVVTAHPDDECMFFGPSILHFTEKTNALVYLLCLSPGNYYGKGKIRRKELWASCKRLGIPSENIYLYRCDYLPDDPSLMWPTVYTSQIINHHTHALDIDAVVTFDANGVSSHINHSSLFNAVERLVDKQLLPKHCDAYCLESVNLLRKYCSVLDLFLSFVFSSYVLTINFKHFFKLQGAMKAHSSQYVWFRWLYVIFSRYMVINTLCKIK